MKKPTVVFALCAVLMASLAPLALALTRNRAYTGRVGDPRNAASVGLTLRIRNGVPRRVTRFEFRNIPADCSGHLPTAVTDELTGAMTVGAKRRFHGSSSLNGGRATISVSGTVTRDKRRVSGTMRATGTFSGCLHADTGPVPWLTTPAAK